jgi:site-specific DNA recombinase
MKAAIYARYSTDKQREASIEDQYRNCQHHAERQGWTVTKRYADKAVSGSKNDRVQYQQMLADAKAKTFDVLLVDDLSRLSRDDVETKQAIRRLRFWGIRIVGVSDGFDTGSKGYKIHAGMRGLINEIYLDDLAEKTHRGLTGQALKGNNAGGLPYGYRSVQVEDGHRLEINPEQAKWVRWMYEQFAAGLSARKIAHELNRKGVTTGRGKTWCVSALHGHPKYRTGVLRNPIYRGLYVWNRSQWVKDPDTGRRKRTERPEAEWITLEAPELAIVSSELWNAAKVRLTGPKKRTRGKPPRTPLSGLLRCEACGGAVVAVNRRAYGCAANKDRGATVCGGVLVRRDVMERRLVEILRDDLLSDKATAELRQEVAALLAQEGRTQAAEEKATRARLQALEGEISNLTDAVAKAGWSQAIGERLKAAEEERKRLLAAPAPQGAGKACTVIPRLLDHYRAFIARLPELMRRTPDDAREALREMLGEVRLARESGGVVARIPDLAASLKLVAGVGFEPTTFGL